MAPARWCGFACLLVWLLTAACQPATRTSQVVELLGLDANAPLVTAEALLPPASISFSTLFAGRTTGPLMVQDGLLWYVDPQTGIYALEPQHDGATTALSVRANLTPRQQPADIVLPSAECLVARSERGPFALELFLFGDSDPQRPAERTWTHAGCYQRGKYAELFRLGDTSILAYEETAQRLDRWDIDLAKRQLTPVWQWPLPPNLTTLTVVGESLVLGVTDSEFQRGGRPATGTGVLLYGLADDPSSPILHDRWLAPETAPVTSLLAIGSHGVALTQGTSLRLLQRTQQGRLRLIGETTQDQFWTGSASLGRYLLLAVPEGWRLVDLANPRKPRLLGERLPALPADASLAIDGARLWFLAPATSGSPGASAPAFREQINLLDFSKRATSPRAGPVPAAGDASAGDIVFRDPHAFVAQGNKLLVVPLDAGQADPFIDFEPVAQIHVDAGLRQFVLLDHWLYASTFNGGWRVFDIRDPETPSVLPNLDQEGYGRGFGLLQGRRLLAADTRLTIMRISQPGAIYFDAEATLPATATGLAIDKSRTYVACGDAGIEVFDTGEGHPIIRLHQMQTGHHWGALAAGEFMLAAVRNQKEVVLFDTAIVNAPKLIRAWSPGGEITALASVNGTLYVGTRVSRGWGILRTYRIGSDGGTALTGSHLLPGTPILVREGPESGQMTIRWLAANGDPGFTVVPASETPGGLTPLGVISTDARIGPWLYAPTAEGEFLWTVDEDWVRVRDLTQPELPVIAETPFSLDPTIWSGKSKQTSADTLLRATGQGALAVIRKGWISMQATPYGTIGSDPWPMQATEHVLAAANNLVLIWDHERLAYELFRLRPGNAPAPLSDTGWSGVHPETQSGAWEVVDGTFAPDVDELLPLYATAEAYGGAWLYRGPEAIDHVSGLQATAVALESGELWAAAGERTGTHGPPQPVAILKEEGVVVREILLPAAPSKLWIRPDHTLIAVWAGGVTVHWPNGATMTLPGPFADVQRGPGWDDPLAPDELWLREPGSGELQRWAVE